MHRGLSSCCSHHELESYQKQFHFLDFQINEPLPSYYVLSCPRIGARDSNSSKKRIHGVAFWARANKSRTASSLAPMYLLRSSGPLMLSTGNREPMSHEENQSS